MKDTANESKVILKNPSNADILKYLNLMNLVYSNLSSKEWRRLSITHIMLKHPHCNRRAVTVAVAMGFIEKQGLAAGTTYRWNTTKPEPILIRKILQHEYVTTSPPRKRGSFEKTEVVEEVITKVEPVSTPKSSSKGVDGTLLKIHNLMTTMKLLIAEVSVSLAETDKIRVQLRAVLEQKPKKQPREVAKNVEFSFCWGLIKYRK